MLVDFPENRSNDIGCLVMDKFNMKELTHRLKQRAYLHPRTRSVLVEILGNYYWKVLSPEEIEAREHTYMKKLEGIKTEKEICDFMAKEI